MKFSVSSPINILFLYKLSTNMLPGLTNIQSRQIFQKIISCNLSPDLFNFPTTDENIKTDHPKVFSYQFILKSNPEFYYHFTRYTWYQDPSYSIQLKPGDNEGRAFTGNELNFSGVLQNFEGWLNKVKEDFDAQDFLNKFFTTAKNTIVPVIETPQQQEEYDTVKSSLKTIEELLFNLSLHTIDEFNEIKESREDVKDKLNMIYSELSGINWQDIMISTALGQAASSIKVPGIKDIILEKLSHLHFLKP